MTGHMSYMIPNSEIIVSQFCTCTFMQDSEGRQVPVKCFNQMGESQTTLTAQQGVQETVMFLFSFLVCVSV